MEYVFAAGGRKKHFCFDRAWTAKGAKLVLKQLVLVLMDLNRRLPEVDERGSNRSWAGWDESWEMRVALPNRRCWYRISRLGRSLPMIREAVFTTLFNLSVSFCVIDPLWKKISEHSRLQLCKSWAWPVWSNQTILTFLKSTAAAGPFWQY